MTPPPHRPRILQIIDHLGLGGAESAAVALAATIDQRRFEPHLLATRASGPLIEQVREADIPFHLLGRRHRYDLRGLRDFVRFVTRERFDVLHAHKAGSNALARLAAPFLPDTIIITHEHIPAIPGSLSARVNALLSPLSDRIVCCGGDTSRTVVRTLPGVHARILTVPNGIQTRRFRPDATRREATRAALGFGPGALLAIAVGRLHPQKGHEVLLQAWAEAWPALQSHSQGGAHLLIVGEGVREGELKALAETLGLRGSVHFLGPRTDVPDLFRAADVKLLASHYEGMPLVLLEAMASGLPIVTTDVGSIREILTDGMGGRVVPPAQPAAFAEALRWVAAHPTEAAAWGVRNRSHIEAHFSIEAMVDRCQQLYLELLAARGQAVRTARHQPTLSE